MFQILALNVMLPVALPFVLVNLSKNVKGNYSYFCDGLMIVLNVPLIIVQAQGLMA
jgi:hypothetical protein